MNPIIFFKYISLPFNDLFTTVHNIQIHEIITTFSKISMSIVYHEAVITVSLVANHLIRSSIYDLITFII